MHTDFLFIVAEIAAAFAGFTTLVAAISRRQDDTPEQGQLAFGTLQNALVLSLFTVAFALIPSVIERQGVTPSVAWRGSATAAAATIAPYIAYVLRSLVSAYRAANQRAPLTFVANMAVGFASLFTFALCAAGTLPTSSYLLALSALLYLAGFAFVRFFVTIGRASAA